MPRQSSPEASLIARPGAYAMHAKNDAQQTTAKGRTKFLSRFEREVQERDPSIVGNPVEIARRAEHAKKAYFTRLALKSAQARRKAAS
jgi:hypothetical protein